MNFMSRLKGESDIMALCESYSVDHNASFRKTNEASEAGGSGEGYGDDVFNPDDLFNTVDLPEEENIQSGPSFSSEDITLSHEQKESVKKLLTTVLDEIQDKDSISDPALEMIVNEVANQSAYLSEADEANLEGPVEKKNYQIGLVSAIKKFISELLGTTVENGGQMPDNVDEVAPAEPAPGAEGGEGEPGEPGESGEGAGEEPGEGAEPAAEEKKEGEVSSLQEGADADGVGITTKPEDIVESVCTECDGAVEEVEPSDVIRVVDNDDPNIVPLNGEAAPIDVGSVEGLEGVPGAMGAPEGAGPVEGGVGDDTPLTMGVFKQIVSQFLAEGTEGQKSFAELWKNLAGNAIVLPKPGNTKGQEKTSDPKAKAPDGTSYQEPKAEGGNASSLSKPGNTKGQEKTASPTAKAPEGTSYQKPVAPKETTTPAVKKPETDKKDAANLVASVLSEGTQKSAVSFLREAAEAVKNAKKAMNS